MKSNNENQQPQPNSQQEQFDNDVEATECVDNNEVAEENVEEEISEIDALRNQLAEAKETIEKEKKEYLFLMAEFDNYRKRTTKEKSDIIRNAAESAMKGILPIVDDFERGIEANKEAADIEAVKEGMILIYNKFIKYLEQNGVKAAESTGKPFDPDTQEAIALVPVPDEEMKGKVIDTPTKGYTINDKVLRHAKVVVGQ